MALCVRQDPLCPRHNAGEPCNHGLPACVIASGWHGAGITMEGLPEALPLVLEVFYSAFHGRHGCYMRTAQVKSNRTGP